MKPDTIAPSLLGLIEGLIGRPEEVVRCDLMTQAAQRGTYTYRDRFVGWQGSEPLASNGAAQSVGDSSDLARVGARQENHKFVAPVTRHHVTRPELASENPPKRREDGVSSLV